MSPTRDHAAVAAAVDRLELDESTAIGEAVFASLAAVRSVPVEPGEDPPPARIVLLSDGTNTVGRPLSAAAEAARADSVPVSTIAYGTPDGRVDVGGGSIPVPVDVDALDRLARADRRHVVHRRERRGAALGLRRHRRPGRHDQGGPGDHRPARGGRPGAGARGGGRVPGLDRPPAVAAGGGVGTMTSVTSETSVATPAPSAGQPGGPLPGDWEADVVLNDGGTAHLRPIRPDDADRLREFHSRLSQQTVYNRFFAYHPTLSDADVARFTTVDHVDRVALVATLHGQIIGVVRYDRLPGADEGEVAFVVQDAHQGRGLGPVLLEHLAAAARERGVVRFTADVLPTNRAMLGVFKSAGYQVRRALGDGYVELSFPIQQTGTSLEVMRDREHRAEARSVQRLLRPTSVAVVGASREPGAPGHEVLRSLLAHGFEGPVFPVNPAAAHVSGVRAYADVRDIPDPVDLAVVAVPAPEVADVVRACSDKDVRGLVVVSGGFADGGPEGRARLEEVVHLARDGGMRLIGPNAMGVVNTDPAVRLHATFASGSPLPGSVGVFSQSGALAGTFLQEAARRQLGLSAFVSIGDRADVSGNDLLQHWRADERTEVVVLHLRGFGNPRKFARIAREVGRTKPVVALKSGRGQGDAAVSALFASAGVVRVGSLAQLFETAQLFALQPMPAGRRVAVVGTSNALAALAADACREAGLEVPELPEDVRVRLRALTGTTETANPVDLGPVAGAEELTAALDVLTGSGQVDAVLAVVVPPPHAGAGGAVVDALGGALRVGRRGRAAGRSPASSAPTACPTPSPFAARPARRCAAPSRRTPPRSRRRWRCRAPSPTPSGGPGPRAPCATCPTSTSTRPARCSRRCRRTARGCRSPTPPRCSAASGCGSGPRCWCTARRRPCTWRARPAGRSRSRRRRSSGGTASTSARCGSTSATRPSCARPGRPWPP